MRCGMTLYIQNYDDWERYEAIGLGESAPPLDPQTDVKWSTEEIDTALKIEDRGYHSLWTVEHHFSPYTSTTNPLQLLTCFASANKAGEVSSRTETADKRAHTCMEMRFGSMPKGVADKSVALFAKEVLPAIHEIELEDPITYSAKRPQLVYG